VEVPCRDGNDASEEVWASVLLRSVAYLAHHLPDEESVDDCRGRRPAHEYGPDAAQDHDTYRRWLTQQAGARKDQRERNRHVVANRRDVPAISVVIAGDALGPELSQKTWDSAREQDLRAVDIVGCPEHGLTLAEGWNRGAGRAAGDFLAFVEAGDELETGVLADVALAVADEPEADFLYTDSDSLDAEGRRVRPFFKPGWSPDQLLSHMYIGRLMVVRRSLFQAVGGFRPELGEAHEHDLALRATERARRVLRIPIVGYHRRSPNPVNDENTIVVLENALRRRGERGTAEPGLSPGTYRVCRPIQGEPLVSVIVPFHNGAEHLRRCMRALDETAGHDRWEAVLVDNRSWDPNTRALAVRLERDPRVRILPYPGRFNWAAINNYAARQSPGSHLSKVAPRAG
jgi:O-antigen biosynthesis protein